MAEFIGTAASLLQLAEVLAKGLATLRKAYLAIKDAPKRIKEINDSVNQAEISIMSIQNYIETQPPPAADLRKAIHLISTSCLDALSTIRGTLENAGKSKKRVAAAVTLWANDHDVHQATRHIDARLQNLQLILQVLQLIKTDQVEATLLGISSFLRESQERRTINHNIIASRGAIEQLDIEINGKIRAATKEMAASIATDEPDDSRCQTAGRLQYIDEGSALRPSVAPGRKELDHELEANRRTWSRLTKYDLYESAVIVQERALEIRTLMAALDRVPWIHTNEHDEMREALADMLLQCGTAESQDQGFEILLEQLARLTERTCPSANASPLLRVQKCNTLRIKLGQICMDTGQLENAKDYFRMAFEAYEREDPRDSQKLRCAGEQLLDVYNRRIRAADPSQKVLFQTQLQGFRTEFHAAVGRPSVGCKEAVDWCERENIRVFMSPEREHRFDITMADEESSPLHSAAEKCRDETVLQQIIENSDTLDRPNGDFETPLLVAVGSSNSTAVALLLQHGANIRARDKESQTVLHRSQLPEVTELLLQPKLRRASIATHISTDTRLSRSDSAATSFTAATATTFSISSPETDLDVDARDIHQKTALWVACSTGRAKTAILLLAAKADPNILRYHKSPLAAVIESKAKPYFDDPNRRLKVVKALIKAGADPQTGKDVLHRPRGTDKKILRALEQPHATSSQLLFATTSSGATKSSSGESSEARSSRSPTSD